MTFSTRGMTEITLVNRETQQEVSYTVTDIAAAKMLAAEDHGGEPEDWMAREEIVDVSARFRL